MMTNQQIKAAIVRIRESQASFNRARGSAWMVEQYHMCLRDNVPELLHEMERLMAELARYERVEDFHLELISLLEERNSKLVSECLESIPDTAPADSPRNAELKLLNKMADAVLERMDAETVMRTMHEQKDWETAHQRLTKAIDAEREVCSEVYKIRNNRCTNE